MHDTNDINKMDYKQLRKEVQLLRDELAIMQRKYEDILYNLDDDNFSSKLIREKDNMKTSIEVTAGEIKTRVSNKEFESAKITLANQITSEVKKLDGTLSSRITQNENSITSEVQNRANADAQLSTRITQTAQAIQSKVSTQDLADALQSYSTITQTATDINLAVSGCVEDAIGRVIEYYTGIGITEGEIKMITSDGNYAIFTDEGIVIFNNNQKEGWSLEPDSTGGTLNYYYNNTKIGSLGTGKTGTNYTTSDMVLKAEQNTFARFIVDLAKSGYREVKFVGLNNLYGYENIPCIYANEKLLATQSWVLENAGGGTAKFA